jgi:hypothetical protein
VTTGGFHKPGPLLARRRGAVFEIPTLLDEDAAMERLEVQRLLPAMTAATADEHESHGAVRRREIPDVAER